jgi:hypothetical protein
MAVTMDPKPEKLKENVVLNFRHLKVTTTTKIISSFCPHLVEKVIKLNLFSAGC